jgi:hypothetical protein
MPIKFSLGRTAWKSFQTSSGLGKLPWYKQVDVGPSINNFWTAYQAYDLDPSLKNLNTTEDKAKTLKSAFAKFALRKATTNELTPTQWNQIKSWMDELDEIIKDDYLKKDYVKRRK